MHTQPDTHSASTQQTITLISHKLCPYVQRAAIVLAEKGIEFERVYIDLANKPDWFLNISPLGKTPVLLTGQQAIFESSAICEYLDDVFKPGLHPEDPVTRARHRGWMEFGSSVLNAIGGYYNAKDGDRLNHQAGLIQQKFEQLEAEISDGPFFNGQHFSMVDAVFAPVFRYFDLFDQISETDFFASAPRVRQWRNHLSRCESVQHAVAENYTQMLADFVLQRQSELSKKITNELLPS
ncbi:glutathione S-transferase family protein [Oceanospirillum sediminis]|uniref:glutathione transferase n=1 Tax=Oceanospirillum sediminis TaxID=2760088 RepID=A0A839ILM0_9GAMM|nr:glutathione S-transferase family protein [Oceanospirillum sediminis]MBB1485781.1 glutathione S-transferase family protein [Oceanospirillum sediminis]